MERLAHAGNSTPGDSCGGNLQQTQNPFNPNLTRNRTTLTPHPTSHSPDTPPSTDSTYAHASAPLFLHETIIMESTHESHPCPWPAAHALTSEYVTLLQLHGDALSVPYVVPVPASGAITHTGRAVSRRFDHHSKKRAGGGGAPSPGVHALKAYAASVHGVWFFSFTICRDIHEHRSEHDRPENSDGPRQNSAIARRSRTAAPPRAAAACHTAARTRSSAEAGACTWSGAGAGCNRREGAQPRGFKALWEMRIVRCIAGVRWGADVAVLLCWGDVCAMGGAVACVDGCVR